MVLWFVIVGVVLVVMALTGSVLKRLPLTTSMLYLGLGFLLGPAWLGLIDLDPLRDSKGLERATEIAVLISLFTAGLKLRVPLTDRRWRAPFRLAFLSMTLTVGLTTLVGVFLLQLSLGAAVLLGAVLAPTDPVLASDVQVEHPADRDHLRFTLTGEAGLNDGTAFPFVMLGLGLLGHHSLGPFGAQWLGVDVLWAVGAGLGIGAGLGWLVGKLVLHVRKRHGEGTGLDDFLALGLITLSYGLALVAHSYGFLAVFAAGYALRGIERKASSQSGRPEIPFIPVEPGHEEEVATAPATAPAYLAQAVLSFNEQMERIAEVAMVIMLGALLVTLRLTAEMLWFVPLLLLGIRPLAAYLGLAGSPLDRNQRCLTAWFGIRGIGSLYYLMYALQHGVPPGLGRVLVDFTLVTVATSIVVHGVSVTPLMNRYNARVRRFSRAPQSRAVSARPNTQA